MVDVRIIVIMLMVKIFDLDFAVVTVYGVPEVDEILVDTKMVYT